MLPNNQLSSVLISGEYLPPDDRVRSGFTIDYEKDYNGIVWIAELINNTVWLYAESAPSNRISIFSDTGISEISFCFDQLGFYVLAYIKNEQCFLWWYDTSVAQTVITLIPNAYSPVLSLDDKRVSQAANSDVILSYLTDANVCIRVQRDRYNIERVLKSRSSLVERIRRAGMNNKNRFQITMYNK